MPIKRVGPEEAKALIDTEGYIYVDVRSIPEFAEGHPAGAYNIPLMHRAAGGMQPNSDFVHVFEKAFDKAQKIVVGCQAGGRSARAAEMLAAAGFANVIVQQAGWSGQSDPFGRVVEAGWKAKGLPSSTSPEQGRAYEEIKAKLKG